jgi:hypothetical protein
LTAARTLLKEGDLRRATAELGVVQDLWMANVTGKEEAQALLEECEKAGADDAVSSAFADMSDAEFRAFTATGELPAKAFFTDADVNSAFAARLKAKRDSAPLLRKTGLEEREARQRSREAREEKALLANKGLVGLGKSLDHFRAHLPALRTMQHRKGKTADGLTTNSWKSGAYSIAFQGPENDIAFIAITAGFSLKDSVKALAYVSECVSVASGADKKEIARWMGANIKGGSTREFGDTRVSFFSMGARDGAVFTVTVRHKESRKN